MPLPIIPIAGIAFRYAIVACAAYTMARQTSHASYDQRGQDAMDDLPEGIRMRRDSGQTTTTGRFCRNVRIGDNGPGLEIDFAALGRVRIRRI